MKLIRCNDKFVHNAWTSCENALTKIRQLPNVELYSFLEDHYKFNTNKRWAKKIIKSPFIGIIHTPLNSFKYTKERRYRFNGFGFLESLKNCKGLFFMSKAELENWRRHFDIIQHKPWRENLKKSYDLSHIELDSIMHPARPFEEEHHFCWEEFKDQKHKKIIQSGYWLRKIYSIYKLDTHYNEGTDFEWSKCIKPFDRWNKKQVDITCANDGVTIESWRKQWVRGLLKTQHDEYSKLLRSSVFYLDLYDFTSNNTIIDCITTSTPVLVNRHPASEQYLGKDYPLLYDDRWDAETKLTKPELIKDAHIYLKEKDKSMFSYDYFRKSILDSNVVRSVLKK
jgi:hypothetical protein